MMLGREVPLRTRILVDVCIVIAIICAALTSWLFYERITSAKKKQENVSSAIRTVLCFFQAENQSDMTIPQARRDRAVRLTTAALAQINERPCPPAILGGKR